MRRGEKALRAEGESSSRRGREALRAEGERLFAQRGERLFAQRFHPGIPTIVHTWDTHHCTHLGIHTWVYTPVIHLGIHACYTPGHIPPLGSHPGIYHR